MNIDAILGTLIGDANIYKIKNRPCSYAFSFHQSIEDYAIWKADLLELPYTYKTYNRYDKRTNKYYKVTGIYLKMDKEEKEQLYNLFYKPTKTIDISILNQLSNISVAIWYMDDGNCYYNGNNCHINLAVNSFSENEKDIIINWFFEKYNILFKKHQKSIRITSKVECLKFMDIVENYIPNCMSYKILNNCITKYKNEKLQKKMGSW